MKKVLIVTKIGKNYGALLQAYALKCAIESLNCNVQILNYALPSTVSTYEPYPKITGFKSMRRFLAGLGTYRFQKRSIKKFLSFRDEYFNFTKEYHNFEELLQDPPEAQIYFTGSDQVWNPLINFDEAYYLMFASENTVRASYAASLGISQIPEKYLSEFQKRVKNITFRSVRESSSRELLLGMNICSSVHIDPTLLLKSEQYNKLSANIEIKRPFILLYFLIMPSSPEQYIKELKTLYPDHLIVNLHGDLGTKRIGDVQIADAGPKEFLSLIRDSEAVVTSSFHGTIFSIIFHRPFLSFLPQGTGGRILDLLDGLCLSDQIIFSPNQIEKLKNELPYNEIDVVIEKKQQDAFKYLKKVVMASKRTD